ncbi:ATP-binding protein [Variovorax sp. J22R133]|uniref:ATP-binding response regulator n=1 Tax=Variovorax brevis TaxID=3053503 RepID=UPI0025775407|nr:hybrid sensor histidine kinase/response regulator [Variovorax sp. J22R133]MDM0115577.1 ATP-binding protein [Variovorax sp. J22R133]
MRLSTQPGGTVMAFQFALDCGVACLFAWQYSPMMAAIWLALIAVTTAYRGFFPQQLPDPLTPANLPLALREHTLRIAVHEGAHGMAGVLLFHPHDAVAQLLLGMVMMGMTLSSAFSVSYLSRAMQLAITVLMTPIVVMGLLFGAPPTIGLALLGSALLVMVWKLVAERSRKLEESIGQRHNESELHAAAVANLHAAQQIQEERLRFFSAANHDLRQPVMAIGLQTEVLQRQIYEGASTQTVQATLASLARAQDALEGLTNQLLEIGRIEAAADPLTPGAVPLAPLLGEFARQVSGYRVRVRCPMDAIVWSDPVALRRMVANLVDNAIKFTPRGRVMLACRKRGERWRVEVRDNGIGIAPEAQERVFGDFEQVGNDERNLRRGHGLGLAIVRRLAQRLGVQVTLRSAPGRGSVFAFEMAAAPQPLPVVSAPTALSKVLASTLERDTVSVRPGLAVLVVEDNAVVADSLVAILKQWNAQPHAYGSAAEALALANLQNIDVALCDIRLPGNMDGVALAARLQQQKPDLTVALISADIDKATSALARERGWLALRKPVQLAELRAVLASVPPSPPTATTVVEHSSAAPSISMGRADCVASS